MRSLLLAWLTAVWMLRKRQLLELPEAQEPLARALLALVDLLDEPLRVRLADDQRLLVVPAVAGHRALARIGEERLALGVGERPCAARSANAPRRATSVHTLLIRTGTYTIRDALESLAVLPRLGLILLALLLVPASASAAPRVQHLHFKYGPVSIQPGQNTIVDRRRQGPAPEGVRLDRRLPPQPAAPRRLGPARRRDPPPPRGVADQRAPDVRGRRGEDAGEAARAASAGATRRTTSGSSTT